MDDVQRITEAVAELEKAGRALRNAERLMGATQLHRDDDIAKAFNGVKQSNTAVRKAHKRLQRWGLLRRATS